MRDMGIPLFSASTDKELLDDYVDGPITAAVSLARHTSLGLRPGGSEASLLRKSLRKQIPGSVEAGLKLRKLKVPVDWVWVLVQKG